MGVRHRSTCGSPAAKPPPPPTLKVQRCSSYSCLQLSPPAPAELPHCFLGSSSPPVSVVSLPLQFCAPHYCEVADKCLWKKTNPPSTRAPVKFSMLVRPSGHHHPVLTTHPLPAWSSCTDSTLRHFPPFPAPLRG